MAGHRRAIASGDLNRLGTRRRRQDPNTVIKTAATSMDEVSGTRNAAPSGYLPIAISPSDRSAAGED
jgi:hypothetical protein